MKFAHLADCHIGSWRDPKLKDAAINAFVKAVDLSISKNIDFMLISGDLFNTSVPIVDNLKQTVEKLKQLRDKNIPVYMIAGSHDFSPSGKTMLDVLEKAGLITNVAKGNITDEKLCLNFITDKKTGAKITGLLGKKGSLEREYYENLNKELLEKEQGYKIFLFHSALTEFKPESLKDIESHPLSLLPKNFNYYAGGHVHYIFKKQEENYGLISYPGPLFPNNFKELEDLGNGGIYFVDVEEVQTSKDSATSKLGGGGMFENKAVSKENISSLGGHNNNSFYKTSISYEPILIHNTHSITIDANNKTPEKIQEEILSHTKEAEFNNTIITLRIEGTLYSGKPSDINFKDIFKKFYDKSAYFVMKNTNKLQAKEFEEIKVNSGSVDEIESRLIKEHLGQIKVSNLEPEREKSIVETLMSALSREKEEGETTSNFELKIKEDMVKILNL